MQVDVLSGVSRNEGGLFYSVRWLSLEMLRSGVDIRLISHVDEFTQEDLPVWNPMPVELHPGRGPLLSSSRLRSILKQSPAELLHVHGIWLDRQWAALQWQKRTGKPVVISPRGMLDPWAIRNSAWKKKLVGALFANESLRKASCIHALCQSEAESIRAYGIDSPVAIIPNGVKLPKIGSSLPVPTGKRKQLLFLGRIHPKKGLSELLSGWAGLRGLKPSVAEEWQLVIAGWDDGGHLAGLKKQADELGLTWADNQNPHADIQFPGAMFGDGKGRLLRSVDAFILPSFSEGLPMSVLEAWSYGLPVLMTDECNIPEGFEAEAAIRIEPNAGSITDGLAAFGALDAGILKAMGANGRVLVEQSFTWDRIARDMVSVYEWCMGGDKPACIL